MCGNGLQISNHALEADAALVSVASVAWPAEPEELLSAEADAALLRGLFLELESCLDWLAEGGAGAFSTLPGGVSACAAPSTSQHMTDHMHSHLTTCMCIRSLLQGLFLELKPCLNQLAELRSSPHCLVAGCLMQHHLQAHTGSFTHD